MSANLIATPSAANTFFVAGDACPGVATVSDCVDHRKLDVQLGTGTSGAKVVFHGAEPKAFKVVLHLMTVDDYDQWLNGPARATLKKFPTDKGSKPGQSPKAFAVLHPSCQECGILAATTESVSQGEPVGDGSYKVTLSLMPNNPPKPGLGTPAGSQTKWNDTAKSDAADAEIQKLLNEAKNL